MEDEVIQNDIIHYLEKEKLSLEREQEIVEYASKNEELVMQTIKEYLNISKKGKATADEKYKAWGILFKLGGFDLVFEFLDDDDPTIRNLCMGTLSLRVSIDGPEKYEKYAKIIKKNMLDEHTYSELSKTIRPGAKQIYCDLVAMLTGKNARIMLDILKETNDSEMISVLYERIRPTTRVKAELQEIARKKIGEIDERLLKLFTTDAFKILRYDKETLKIIKEWTPGKIDTKKKQEIDNILKKENIKTDNVYYAKYDKNGKLLANQEDIEAWEYGKKASEPGVQKNPKSCEETVKVLKVLSIDMSPELKGFLDEKKSVINRIQRKTASFGECTAFLADLRERTKNKRIIKQINVIESKIVASKKKKPFRIEEWDRKIESGALGNNEEDGACIFAGGTLKETIVEILKNPSIIMLDYYMELKNVDTRVNRAMLGIVLEKTTKKPVLYVDKVYGNNRLPYEHQYLGIVDYARDRGYSQIIFNKEILSNVNPMAFAKYIMDKKGLRVEKMTLQHLNFNEEIKTDGNLSKEEFEDTFLVKKLK